MLGFRGPTKSSAKELSNRIETFKIVQPFVALCSFWTHLIPQKNPPKIVKDFCKKEKKKNCCEMNTM